MIDSQAHNSVLSTNKPSLIRRHNQFNIHNPPSDSDSADSAFFTSVDLLITSLDRLLLLRQLLHLLHLKQQLQSVHRPIVLPVDHEAVLQQRIIRRVIEPSAPLAAAVVHNTEWHSKHLSMRQPRECAWSGGG